LVFVEALFGLAKLTFEVPNPALQSAKVTLRREIQFSRDALHALVEGPFHATPVAKALHHNRLNLAFSHELHHSRVLQKHEYAVFESGHLGDVR
jgi:hypothetical protein